MNELTTITQNIEITNKEQMATFIANARTLQNALDVAWGAVKQQMKDRGIDEIVGDWGSLSPTERKLWTVSGATPAEYVKVVADEKALNAAYLSGHTIPGTDFKVIKYVVPHYTSKKRVLVEA